MSEYSQEDRQAICASFARLLEENANEPKLRELIETRSGFDRELWQKMADMGLTGITIAPEHSGAGGSLEEVEALLEIAGGFLLCGPFIESCVIAPALLLACEDQEFAGQHLQAIAAGSSIFAVAGCGSSGDWDELPDVVAEQQDGHWCLSGSAHFVAYANVADHCLVAANVQGEIGVFLVAMEDPAITATLHKSSDPTQRLSTLSFDSVRATRLAGVDEQAWSGALVNGLVALAGEQVGGAQRIFTITIEYLKIRHQFGQAIGSFQSLKHMAADLLVELESATSVARHAARAIAAGNEDAATMSYLAAFTCADNYRRIAADAIQLHGGIAYTVEHPAHLYWRRAQSGQWAYCSSDRLRDLYLAEMEKNHE
ncbi:acyl-CoA dehydrogenase [Halieaceae bacterium IMCC14734]|uniref:Acyl-CoA dehydrogenase n=1 Tax=Candidatus Litorirhabdus singularis TaxID=2518993 RepID=A0ABT3TEE8_9GAMM|nr:acyl-CoA/acyl-ACP dehydrogenase [Candidatus Litorirhabdus singularis]MCX2980695.1 acyl-CoA dehydrogenase [Candidatus Litorirhabdus singularis]